MLLRSSLTFRIRCSITSVGATQDVPEIVATFSSGGFSDVFTQPSYQTTAVNAYKAALGSEFNGLFNPTGRGFPDVSAIGLDLEIVLSTDGVLVFGTSCSSPIFASVVALINDGLLSNGKSTMGFLNPFLYSSGISGLNDITSGTPNALYRTSPSDTLSRFESWMWHQWFPCRHWLGSCESHHYFAETELLIDDANAYRYPASARRTSRH